MMKIIKLVPFYLFLAYNIVFAIFFVLTYPDMMDYDMHWGYEGCSWAYKSKMNYTILIFLTEIVLVFSSVYAWRKRKENSFKASIAAAVPFVVLFGRSFFHTYFPELIFWFSDVL